MSREGRPNSVWLVGRHEEAASPRWEVTLNAHFLFSFPAINHFVKPSVYRLLSKKNEVEKA